jgi:sugar/nucleoside kinase (ribokinase family)
MSGWYISGFKATLTLMRIEKKLPDPSIFGLGLIALDLLLRDGASKMVASAGGTCGNILAILAALGWDSYPIARLDNDTAGHVVREDLTDWGVHPDYLQLQPLASTPVIIEHLSRDKSGIPAHTFSRRCPSCDQYLPGYQAVTANAIAALLEVHHKPTVVFVDRASKSALKLVEKAAAWGALVFFEPSSSREDHFFERILQHTHILKYSGDRFADFGSFSGKSKLLLEIQTLGRDGLQFRAWFDHSQHREWRHLRAFPISELIDSCGAGDWFTSGLIFSLCQRGYSGLKQITEAKLLSAFALAQRLASWSCGFPGARGAMYALDELELSSELRRLIKANDVTMPSRTSGADSDRSHTQECLRWTPLRRKHKAGLLKSAR